MITVAKSMVNQVAIGIGAMWGLVVTTVLAFMQAEGEPFAWTEKYVGGALVTATTAFVIRWLFRRNDTVTKELIDEKNKTIDKLHQRIERLEARLEETGDRDDERHQSKPPDK